MNKFKKIGNCVLIFVFIIMQVLTLPVLAEENIKNSSVQSEFQLKQSMNPNNRYTVGENFDINYDIGSIIGINKSDYDNIYKKDKEIVLVVDTSGSMTTRCISKMYRLNAFRYEMDDYGRWYPVFNKSIYNEKTGMYDDYVMLENGEKYIVYDVRDTGEQYVKINDKIYYKYIKKDNKRYYLKNNYSNGYIYAVLFEKSRIDELQKSANNFVSKFKDKDNVKIGLVSYANTGKVVHSLTNESQRIASSIDSGLSTGGATNIGDGIRIANGLLNNGNSADKYIILMTDGIPTAATCYNDILYKDYRRYSKYGEILDGHENPLSYFNHIESYKYKFEYNPNNYTHDDENVIMNYGDNDYGDIALNYSKQALKKANNSGVNNFVIGFSNGINRDKLNEIATSGSGYYREAMYGDELTDVYNRIADEINNPVVKDIEFKLNLPEGLVAEDIIDGNSKNSIKSKLNARISNNGRTIKFKLDNIVYNKQKDENGVTKYVVSNDQLEKFKFSIKVRANKSGEYVLGDTNNYGAINYTDVNGVKKEKRFETEKIMIKDGKEPLSVEKMGLFLGEDNFKIIEKDVKIMNGFRCQIGTVINIEDGRKAEEFIQNNSVLKSSILGVNTIGKSNFKLYSIENNKLKLVTELKDSDSNKMIISKDTLKKNGKYVLVQDCIPSDLINKDYNVLNKIELEINGKNEIKAQKQLKIKLVNELPDLD